MKYLILVACLAAGAFAMRDQWSTLLTPKERASAPAVFVGVWSGHAPGVRAVLTQELRADGTWISTVKPDGGSPMSVRGKWRFERGHARLFPTGQSESCAGELWLQGAQLVDQINGEKLLLTKR